MGVNRGAAIPGGKPGRCKIDVRHQSFARFHLLLDPDQHPVVIFQSGRFANLQRHFLQDARARIAVFVNSVPDSHDLFLVIDGVIEKRIHLRIAANLLQHLHHCFICAAVERTFERPDRGRDVAVIIAGRRSNHSCRESGGVELMVRMEHQSRVKEFFLFGRRWLVANHVQEIPGDGFILPARLDFPAQTVSAATIGPNARETGRFGADGIVEMSSAFSSKAEIRIMVRSFALNGLGLAIP